MSLIIRLIAGIALFGGMAAAQTSENSKQPEFGGVKLGTKITALGLKLDDVQSIYTYKNKYTLFGSFGSPGHPVFKVALDCENASTTDQLEGIKCGDPLSKVIETLASRIAPMCSTVEDYDWEDQHYPTYFYDKNTSRFWAINGSTKKVYGFGVAVAGGDFAPCVRKFTDDEISRVTLGMSARTTLGFNLRNERHGFSFLRDNVSVSFDNSRYDLPINKISFICDSSMKNFEMPNRNPDCGVKITDFQNKYGSSVTELCDQQTGDLEYFYRRQTKEFWGINSVDSSIFSFGLWTAPDLVDCNKVSIRARLAKEAKSRAPNSPPLPLIGSNSVFRIKGVALGDGPSSCPKIDSVSFTNDRYILNICTIEEGENITRIFFDITKRFVVKIERRVFVNDKDRFIADALQFYGSELQLVLKDESMVSDQRIYEFGNTKESRGLQMDIMSCFKYSVDCSNSQAEYVVTFLMVDVGAFNEALEEGHKAYRKKEF